MANILVYISNDDAHNYPFHRLQLVVETFELNEPTNDNFIKSPKELRQRWRKRYNKLWGLV